MKPSHIMLFGTNAFGIGLLSPVLSLVLLKHGASLESLSLCVGIFAVMVILFELPSGILADIIGRKLIFQLSVVLTIMAYFTLLLDNGFLLLLLACFFLGTGRAFSSGSIESLEIETFLEQNQGKGLERINNIMTITESAGLALGSIMGGVLGYLDGTYTALLLVSVWIQAAVLLMSVCFVKEPPCKKRRGSFPALLKGQVTALYCSIRKCPVIFTILLMTVTLGMTLATIEIYWQPALTAFLPAGMGWILGIINCLGFAGVSLGSKLSEMYWKSKNSSGRPTNHWKNYLILRFLLLGAVMVLGLMHSVWWFVLTFILIYALLGAGNLWENTIFHSAVSNNQRASMMSLSSLTLRGGGLIASLLGSLVISRFSLSSVWYALPAAAAVMIILIVIKNSYSSSWF